MFFWKCWRDTRFSFFGYLTTLVALSTFMTLIPSMDHRGDFEWNIVREAKEIPAIRQAAMMSLSTLGMIVLALAGMALGSGAIGRERKTGGLEFLLTRPRTRKYVLWGNWAFGCTQLLAIILASVMSVFLMSLWLTRGEPVYRLWLLVPGLMIAGTVFYGLSFCMTMLLGDGQKGLSVAVLVAVLYGTALMWSLTTILESISMRQALLRWAVDGTGSPWNLAAGVWVLLALAFPAIAWWRFSRLDV